MLNIQHIVKQYEQHRALDDISLIVPQASIFGLLGPNGAGKTSLIRIINQITAPDEGEILFNNEKLNKEHIHKIGYLPEERGLYKKMEIGEQLIYLSRLKGLSRSDAVTRSKYWFEKLDIASWWHKKVEDLSKGMQQKVQFVATVLHEPELIILDEPFSGFDPVNVELIKNEIIELNKKGATIIFSTHRMDSVEELCERIALINKSKKVLEGKVSDIRNTYRSNSYKIRLTGHQKIPLQQHAFKVLEEDFQQDYLDLKIQKDSAAQMNQVLSELMHYGQIVLVEEIIPSIHDIFIEKVKQGA